ncbi:MAG TPA: hypothetical protein VH277_12680 [Gemmatimonadaceae bacterium]|nr:hypothetical protein [Gemmatimonadaceae bacterium]
MTALLASRRRLRTPIGFAIVALLFYAIDGLIVRSSVFGRDPELMSAAVSFDLTLGVTLAYYLMVVRPGLAAARSVLPVFVASIVAAAITLPAGHRDLLRDLRYLALPLELVVIGMVVIGVRATNRRLALAGTTLDVPERIRAALAESMHGRIADVIALECSIFYYALASWRRKAFVPHGAQAFSYHRKNGYAALLYTLVRVTLMEMIALDFLVRARHPHAANWLLAIDLFGALWLTGFARAVQLRPILLEGDLLRLRLGLQWAADVRRSNIASIEFGRVRAPAKRTPGYLRIASSPNAMITLREPVRARGPYGTARDVVRIGVALDDVKKFEHAMRV